MKCRKWLVIMFFGLAPAGHAAANAAPVKDSGFYAGTTPCDRTVRDFLDISSKAGCDFVQWDLSLIFDGATAPPRFNLTAEYATEGGKPTRVRFRNRWHTVHGAPEHPDAVVYRLAYRGRELHLWRVGPNTLYLLDHDRRLLVGNSNYSYALATATVKRPRPDVVPARVPYPFSGAATGAEVFGVYDGRTPCGLEQVLGLVIPAGCAELHWRLTLLQDASTRTPTNYRLEGTLFPAGPREGPVTHLVSTSSDRDAAVLVLEPPPGGHPVYLMRGDDNVFFFVDRTGNLGLGSRDAGYVLNRHTAP